MGAMTDDRRIARRIVVHGHVQGVFYRDSCRREADHVGVTGWATNEPDGTVSAVFEGPADAVDSMIAWAKQGSRESVVDRIDVEELDPPGATEFRVQ